MLRPGEAGAVLSAGGSSMQTRQRLADMGVTPGVRIQVKKLAPLGDPMEVALRGYTLSLRKGDADRILLADGPLPLFARPRERTRSDCPAGCSGCSAGRASPAPSIGQKPNGAVTLALLGNPNAGKTTLFNALTGARETVGNWPGVTVERKERRFSHGGRPFTVVDLPGVYALSPCSMEEKVVTDFLTRTPPDAIVHIADATSLERSLYLTMQLIELHLPVVLALNMMDAAEKAGVRIDTAALSQMLHIPVCPICARTGQGLDALLTCCGEAADGAFSCPDGRDNPPRATMPRAAGEAAVALAARRYDAIEAICSAVRRKPREAPTRSDRIDRVLTHRYLGIPIFFLVMAGLFLLTFDTLGAWLTAGVETLLGDLALPLVRALLLRLHTPDWLAGLLCDGILTGVGGVLTFLPQITLLFFFLSLLEDSGYLSRTAFLMDKWLQRLGLSGKAFIPLLLGFGCTVPAAMSTRTMDRPEEKRLVLLLLPFVSCSAKLPVYALLAGAFFARARWLILLALYGLGAAMGVLTGVLFRKTLFRRNRAGFLMELPSYCLPDMGNTLLHVGERVGHFIGRAGTVIVGMSVVLWVLMRYTPRFTAAALPEASCLGLLGKGLAPLLGPLGFGNWQAAVALLTGLVAKEAVVSTLSLVLGVPGGAALTRALRGLFTPLQAFSFGVFVLLYMPCMAAVATMRRELGSGKWTAFLLGYQLLTAYLTAFVVYRVGLLMGL